MVNHGIDSLNNSINGFLKYCRDDKAGVYLLNILKDIAKPADMDKWRNIESTTGTTWGYLQDNVDPDQNIELNKIV